MLGLRFDWRRSTRILRSPAIRVTALIPVLGYLIIFSSEMSGWLNTSVVGETFLLSPTDKIRMIYYGGAALVLALIIHTFWCPRTIKEFDNAALAMEDFWQDGTARKAMLANQRLLHHVCGDSFFPQLQSPNERKRLEAYKNASFDYLATSGFPFGTAERDALNAFKARLADDAELKREFALLMQDVLKKAFEHHAKNPSLLMDSTGGQLVGAVWNWDLIRLPWIRIPTAVFAQAGALLIAIPAMETFIHVLVVDFPFF